MRFIDFLILLLKAHAETLQRLAAFFGEEELLALLESAGENVDQVETSFVVLPDWFELPEAPYLTSAKKSVYSELEGAVQTFNLAAPLEFHLWAYPFYRVLIEGTTPLKSKMSRTQPKAITLLVEKALSSAVSWIRVLPIRPEISPQAERAAMIPWLKFRAEILKKSGQRPISPV